MKKKPSQATPGRKDKVTEIAILLYKDHQTSAVYGLMDLFEIANLFVGTYTPQQKLQIRVSHWTFT